VRTRCGARASLNIRIRVRTRSAFDSARAPDRRGRTSRDGGIIGWLSPTAGRRRASGGSTNRVLDSANTDRPHWLTPRERYNGSAPISQRFETVLIGEFAASARSRRRPCRLQPGPPIGPVCTLGRPFGALRFAVRARGADKNALKRQPWRAALPASRLLVYRFRGSGVRSERSSIRCRSHESSFKCVDHELTDRALVLDHGLEEDGLAAGEEGDGARDRRDTVGVGDRAADDRRAVELQRVLL